MALCEVPQSCSLNFPTLGDAPLEIVLFGGCSPDAASVCSSSASGELTSNAHTGGSRGSAGTAQEGLDISAIARHLGRDRKTVRAYLEGGREPGKRKPAGRDSFAVVEAYCRIRLAQDPHLQATALFEEVAGLGYGGGYSSFTRAVRDRRLRPHCEPCHQVRDRDVAIIAHEPGAETQWDWVHLPDPPRAWEWPGLEAYLLAGSLPYSGRWRGWLSVSMDQPHLIAALHEVAARLGGLTGSWRFDRMATVWDHQRQDVSASFAAVARHYGVAVAVCPPRRGQRKGSVEKSNDMAAQRWWRTVPDDITPELAQASLNGWCARTADRRVRWKDKQKMTVATFAAAERACQIFCVSWGTCRPSVTLLRVVSGVRVRRGRGRRMRQRMRSWLLSSRKFRCREVLFRGSARCRRYAAR